MSRSRAFNRNTTIDDFRAPRPRVHLGIDGKPIKTTLPSGGWVEPNYEDTAWGGRAIRQGNATVAEMERRGMPPIRQVPDAGAYARSIAQGAASSPLGPVMGAALAAGQNPPMREEVNQDAFGRGFRDSTGSHTFEMSESGPRKVAYTPSVSESMNAWTGGAWAARQGESAADTAFRRGNTLRQMTGKAPVSPTTITRGNNGAFTINSNYGTASVRRASDVPGVTPAPATAVAAAAPVAPAVAAPAQAPAPSFAFNRADFGRHAQPMPAPVVAQAPAATPVAAPAVPMPEVAAVAPTRIQRAAPLPTIEPAKPGVFAGTAFEGSPLQQTAQSAIELAGNYRKEVPNVIAGAGRAVAGGVTDMARGTAFEGSPAGRSLARVAGRDPDEEERKRRESAQPSREIAAR